MDVVLLGGVMMWEVRFLNDNGVWLLLGEYATYKEAKGRADFVDSGVGRVKIIFIA